MKLELSAAEDAARLVALVVAREYDLRHEERDAFHAGWSLYSHIVEVGAEQKKARKERARVAIGQSMQQLDTAIQTGRGDGQRGSNYVGHFPSEKKYVVFSDHHFTFRGHRSNFFLAGGGLPLYVAALGVYDQHGYTLIENGDVEDLVIFDPRYQIGEAEVRENMSLAELEARREQVRLEQLRTIIDDPVNRPLFEAQRRFHDRGALVKIAGNHDYDLQRPEFIALYRQVFPGIEAPLDYALLYRGTDRTDVRYAILHGHQFDPACHPVVAPELGETISETLGLWFQGPDRHWLWNEDTDAPQELMGPEDWSSGNAPFLNVLAAPPDDLVHEGILGWLARAEESLADDVLSEIVRGGASVSSSTPWISKLLELLLSVISGENIAWDYFRHSRPLAAISTELLTGSRFFKFRVLNEEFVRQQAEAVFAEHRPTLVFGHTHEIRFNPWSRETHKTFQYLNSGSAGRFENLIWAVEIDAGEARLVSWSLENGVARRRLWKPQDPEHVRAQTTSEALAL